MNQLNYLIQYVDYVLVLKNQSIDGCACMNKHGRIKGYEKVIVEIIKSLINRYEIPDIVVIDHVKHLVYIIEVCVILNLDKLKR
ncbi:hypothetical protein DICPUDRAFT_153820 [Dictyostelium purpureum]|uniref:Uncharacterized protein n=1 Tax=Dictyostelium purpureum TaxID=5786 RepID=F0ZPU1_DICPU|nr:uncharacterized protein DICPUDRAFT_153820 [Dictyostelium purpureum]EGC34033.1 hypothetical protein DICPUDRAFT_153820 [Dictyostelium purpureum]|eukprot:XP_003289437.1 hypothetical protein DICPUDRAFT_153820 [Dictyostelium purpureum]